MAFEWTVPPWQRDEDCTHTALTFRHLRAREFATFSDVVRGDNATEALADLLMGPSGMSRMMSNRGFAFVVVQRGFGTMYMSSPWKDDEGEWKLSVTAGDAEVTIFSAADTRDMFGRLQVAYAAR
ncbi:hypothetical protein [Embleya sp. NBC_00896]|uniref:hypothetical protein n=1 Tax=Embleya sp. NBC_00896 TaxID=2975961 RepID=UPI003863B18D|nr:hypothetical protein OG928_00440 [Embleya sp. NBC_00896]